MYLPIRNIFLQAYERIQTFQPLSRSILGLIEFFLFFSVANMLPLRQAFGSRIQFEEIYDSNHSEPQFSYLLNEAKMLCQLHKVV